MNKINCMQCKIEFEENLVNNTELCLTCDKKQKSEIRSFQILKQTSFILAIITFSFFLPISLARESGHGYYEILGSKSTPIILTACGLYKFKIVIVILTGFFSALGVWFRENRQEKYRFIKVI